MPIDFIFFSLIFVGLNILLDFISVKFHDLPGIDFLFFAPWYAGVIYSPGKALMLGMIILVIHASMRLKIAHFILVSFPGPILAAYLGNILGYGGFWLSLLVYYAVSSIIVLAMRGLGAKYVTFMAINLIMNVTLFFLVPFVI